MSHYRKKDPKSKKRILIFAVPAAVLVIAAATAGAFLLRHGGAQETVAGAGEKTGNQTTEADLVWNGTAYNYNDHLSNYLFLGIDNREKAETRTGQANAGQADALYLLSWDRTTDDITVITIPRDTMTQIEVFGPDGESLGMTEDHISLSYAYGDGSHESCRLAQDAVSNLLYGLSIQGYCSINMDGLPVLTESVGGVTVTVPNDSLEAADPEFREGAQVTLNGENTDNLRQIQRYQREPERSCPDGTPAGIHSRIRRSGKAEICRRSGVYHESVRRTRTIYGHQHGYR